MKAKNANIELIRIVAMVLVVVHHFFRHGGGGLCGQTLHRKNMWCFGA